MNVIHPYHLHKIRFTEISEIYTSETIKNLAFSLVSVFIPIYLLKNGLTFRDLCVLYIFQGLMRCLLEPIVGKALARYGGKHILALSYPVSFVYVVLLGVYPSHATPLATLAFIWAVAESMHWVAYQAAFSKVKDKHKSGREISAMGVLAVMVGAVGPLVGGFIATRYGLHLLFIVAPLLLLIAMIPLYQSVEIVRSKKLIYKGLVRKYKNDLVAHAAISFDVVAGAVIWPLFIYFIVNDYITLGSIVSLSFFVSIFVLIIIGKLSDLFNKKKLIVVGSVGLAVINIFRNLATTFWFAFGVNIAGIVVGPLLYTPLFSLFYSHADSVRRIEYTVIMEMAGDAARTIMWALLYVLTFWLDRRHVFMAAFGMAVMALLFTNIVKLRVRSSSN